MYPQQQPGYGNPYAAQGYGYAAPPQAAPDKGGGLAIAGLVLGIISIPAAIIAICGYIFAILGFIFSLLGRRSVKMRTLATVGLILSIIGFVASIASSVYGLYASGVLH